MAFVSTSSRLFFNAEASLVQLQPTNKVSNCSSVVSFKQSPCSLFLLRSNSHGRLLKKKQRRSLASISKSLSPVMVWQDCSSSIEVDVPCSVAYQCYSDRESIPKWMTFITSVKILEDKPDLSRWTLKYHAFGQDLVLSWLARNMQPIPNQKIHWRSLDGLPNRGAVHFFPRGPSSCRIELTTSYEVPPILIPIKAAFKPLFEYSLSCGLERFADYAKDYHRKASQLGSVRFISRGPSACRVDLTVSYEVPQILIPVTTAVRPFMEMLLSRCLESFAEYARNCHENVSKL